MIDHYLSCFPDFLPKKSNRRPHLFEFILDLLSEPRYSSIISWEGTSGQFKIINPDQVACLWGERNGRRTMTYQKFTRALRYYYHKNVLSKICGRRHTYKFNIRELERQYGYQEAPSPNTIEGTGNDRCKTSAICYCFCHPVANHNFLATPPMMAVRSQHENEGVPSLQYANIDNVRNHFNFY